MSTTNYSPWIDVVACPRQESAEECAKRAYKMVIKLQQFDDFFRDWIHVPKTKAVTFQPTPQSLEQFLRRGRNIGDDGVTVFEDLGFLTCFGAGTTLPEGIFFHLSCGGWASHVLTGVHCDIPPACPAFERIAKTKMLCGLLAILVDCWQPTWGSVRQMNPPRHGSLFPSYDAWNPNVGWITYISNERGQLPLLSEKFKVVAVEGHGNIIVTTDDFYDPENVRHTDATAELNQILDNAGLLKPIEQGWATVG